MFLTLHVICRYTIISRQIAKFPASKNYQKVVWHSAKMAWNLTCWELYVIVSLDQKHTSKNIGNYMLVDNRPLKSK